MPLFAQVARSSSTFAKLTYISSAGLRVLADRRQGEQGQGRPLALCGLSKPVHEVLQMGNFTKLFAIYEDRTRAVLALARPA